MYQVDYKNIASALKRLIDLFGMSVCNNSDEIDMSKNFHTLYLSGLYMNVTQVCLICLIGFNKDGCVIKLRAKSEDDALTYSVVNAELS